MADTFKHFNLGIDYWPTVVMPAFIDIAQHPQIKLERQFLGGTGSHMESIGQVNEYIMWGGREHPDWGYGVRWVNDRDWILGTVLRFPFENTVIEFVNDLSDPGKITGTSVSFGTGVVFFFDADDRIERTQFTVEPRIRDIVGTNLSGSTINLAVGEQKTLTFYSDPGNGSPFVFGNLINWTDPGGGIISRVGNNNVIVITGVTPGSGDLDVTGWPSTSDSITIVVS